MRWMAALLLAACGFHSHEATSDSMLSGDGRGGDGAPGDAADGHTSDGALCFGGGLATVCLTAMPSGNYDVGTGTTTTVATDSMCTQVVAQSGGPELCVIAGVDVHIDGTLDATGTRPLVVVGTSTLEVSGKIDVSSYRLLSGQSVVGEHIGAGEASANLCGTPTVGGDDASGGAGGGAGGSFGGAGGAGAAGRNGAGGAAGSPTLAVTPTFVRGGCAGSSGGNISGGNAGATAGHGGGAVYLIAGAQIMITGTIQAGGEGGNGGIVGSGGGGAGAGGLIGLDAPSVSSSGTVYANGGGGGEGGGQTGYGGMGASSTSATTAATGGNFNTNGGNGGDGSVLTTLPGSQGMTNNNGGGAGGGGAGVIKVHPAQTLGGTVSPPPT